VSQLNLVETERRIALTLAERRDGASAGRRAAAILQVEVLVHVREHMRSLSPVARENAAVDAMLDSIRLGT
jgi:hypothetical protein